MQCSSCGLPIADGAGFCHLCGAAQPGPCHSCGRASRPGARFCGNCGAPLAAPPPAAAAETPSSRPVSGPGSPGFPGSSDAAAAGIPAGFWIRFAAFIIDACVLGLVEFLLILLHPGVGLEVYADAESFLRRTDTWIDGATALAGLGYYTAGVAVWSTTIGKRLLGLYVLRPDGARVGWGRAFARYWAPIISALLLGVGFLLIAFRPDKRALHDLICGTVVVRRRPPPGW